VAEACGKTFDARRVNCQSSRFPMPPLSDADSALLELGRLLQSSGYGFTTVTPATHGRVNARLENKWARDLAGVFGWSRPFRPDILPREIWKAAQVAGVLAPFENGFRSLVRFSGLSGQLFVHSAFPTEDVDSVFFGPDTYRFALALETLFAQELSPVRRAVDIGTGTGAGAILTALHFPDAEVFAGDINPRALRFTRINALLAGAPNVEPRESNLLRDVDGDFDLIVSNPPYLVDSAERAYRHGGGPLGAGLSLAVVDAALERLAPRGTLLLYTGTAMIGGTDPFRLAIEARLQGVEADWTLREVDPDVFGEELGGGAYAKCERIAAVVLTLTR